MLRTAQSLLATAAIMMPIFALAQGHMIVTPDQLTWRPLTPGVELAVVSGDPDKKGGLYVIRIRTKDEVRVPPHWHPTDEHVTVLTGSFWMGHGEKYDASKLTELRPGGHSLVPARLPHFGLHSAGNVVEVYGEAPFVFTWVNSEDDPNRAKKQ
jgi:hypothetical protein